jgi:iron donor protein CyaY
MGLVLSDSEFQLRCDSAMASLNKALLAAADTYEFEPDFQAGALTIEFEEPREKFVVSPNAPVHQIWVSARVKSYKLDWVEDRGAFVLAATGQSLSELLADLIGERVGEKLSL